MRKGNSSSGAKESWLSLKEIQLYDVYINGNWLFKPEHLINSCSTSTTHKELNEGHPPMQKHAVNNGLQSLVSLVELVVLFENQRNKCAHKFSVPGLSYRTCWCPRCHPKPSLHRRCWMSRFFGQGPGGGDMKHCVHLPFIPLLI